MSLPSFPNPIGVTLGGGFSVDADLDNIKITGLPKIQIDKITTESDVRVKELPKIETDSVIRIKELPKIELEIGMKPTRFHIPSHYQVCFSLLGMEMFKIALCGESMLINEPYVPRATEECN